MEFSSVNEAESELAHPRELSLAVSHCINPMRDSQCHHQRRKGSAKSPRFRSSGALGRKRDELSMRALLCTLSDNPRVARASERSIVADRGEMLRRRSEFAALPTADADLPSLVEQLHETPEGKALPGVPAVNGDPFFGKPLAREAKLHDLVTREPRRDGPGRYDGHAQA